MFWRIEDVSLTQDRVRELFNQYENLIITLEHFMFLS